MTDIRRPSTEERHMSGTIARAGAALATTAAVLAAVTFASPAHAAEPCQSQGVGVVINLSGAVNPPPPIFGTPLDDLIIGSPFADTIFGGEIGRASCRERV